MNKESVHKECHKECSKWNKDKEYARYAKTQNRKLIAKVHANIISISNAF